MIMYIYVHMYAHLRNYKQTHTNAPFFQQTCTYITQTHIVEFMFCCGVLLNRLICNFECCGRKSKTAFWWALWVFVNSALQVDLVHAEPPTINGIIISTHWEDATLQRLWDGTETQCSVSRLRRCSFKLTGQFIRPWAWRILWSQMCLPLMLSATTGLETSSWERGFAPATCQNSSLQTGSSMAIGSYWLKKWLPSKVQCLIFTSWLRCLTWIWSLNGLKKKSHWQVSQCTFGSWTVALLVSLLCRSGLTWPLNLRCLNGSLKLASGRRT